MLVFDVVVEQVSQAFRLGFHAALAAMSLAVTSTNAQNGYAAVDATAPPPTMEGQSGTIGDAHAARYISVFIDIKLSNSRHQGQTMSASAPKKLHFGGFNDPKPPLRLCATGDVLRLWSMMNVAWCA